MRAMPMKCTTCWGAWDLSADEVSDRAFPKASQALAQLVEQRRAVVVTVADQSRWIAAEHAGMYRDALGAVPPTGLPDAYLAPVENPLELLCRQYARTHGPFQSRQLAQRFGLRPAHVEPVLRTLLAQGAIVQGEIRPGGTSLDWCDAEILVASATTGASARRRGAGG